MEKTTLGLLLFAGLFITLTMSYTNRDVYCCAVVFLHMQQIADCCSICLDPFFK